MIKIPCYSEGWGLIPTLATIPQWFKRWRITGVDNYQTLYINGRYIDGLWIIGFSDSITKYICSNDNSDEDLRCEFDLRSISGSREIRAFYFQREFIDLLRFPYSIMVFKGLRNSYRIELIIHDEDAMMLKLIW